MAAETVMFFMAVPAIASDPPQPLDYEHVEVTDAVQLYDFVSRLADQWAEETAIHSSPSARKQHPSFASLVDLGSAAVPILMSRYDDIPMVFLVLRAIVGKNPPMNREDYGDANAIGRAWKQWYADEFYA